MVESKTKKRKNRKIEKRKNLNVINPKFVRQHRYTWIPSSSKLKFSYETNSWFDMRTSCDILQPEKFDRKETKTSTSTLRAERIELYPNKVQRIILLKWMELYRRVYNLTISHRSQFMENGFMISYYKIREYMQHEIRHNNTNLQKQIDESLVLAHSIRNAFNDVRKSFTTAMANKLAGNIRSFRLRHKKLSNPNMTFVLERDAFSKTKNAFALRVLGEINSSAPFGEIKHDCRLSYNKITEKFVLWKPFDKITDLTLDKSSIIAFDPGLKTVFTGYSPDGICYEFATEKTNKKIKSLLKLIDNVKSKHSASKNPNNSRKKYKNKKKYTKRIRLKITNMVEDMHWKVAKIICSNFTTVLVGNMSTTGIVKKDNLVLNRENKIYAIALSHYKFRQRLASKAEEYGVKCEIVDESYTTQTCGRCGLRNLKVGGNGIFKCNKENCNFVRGRDLNAARNIYLKNLSQIYKSHGLIW